jgi:hypothetical protein
MWANVQIFTIVFSNGREDGRKVNGHHEGETKVRPCDKELSNSLLSLQEFWGSTRFLIPDSILPRNMKKRLFKPQSIHESPLLADQ